MFRKTDINRQKKEYYSQKTSQKNTQIKNQRTGSQFSSRRPPGSGISVRNQKQSHRSKKSRIEIFLRGGIITATSVMLVSLTAYFRPSFPNDVSAAAKNLYTAITEQIETFLSHQSDQTEVSLANTNTPETKSQTLSSEETTDYILRSTELGDMADMRAEPVFPEQDDSIYSCILDTPMGPLFYYNQGDIRWKDYLYGGSDRIAKYGCGPVCVAMIINSFTSHGVSPIEMADWSTQNGYYARQGGSYHGLIPGSLSAFGLQVESVTDRTAENVRELLRTGHILVALMGKGSLTQNGHFVIIAQVAASGNVYLADPASYENSTKEWDLQLLMDELKESYDSGGPLWAVGLGA